LKLGKRDRWIGKRGSRHTILMPGKKYVYPWLQHPMSSYCTYYIVNKLSYFITGIMTISGSHTLLNSVRLKKEVNIFLPFMSNITHDWSASPPAVYNFVGF